MTQLIRDCADYLGLTVGELLTIARTAPKRYYVWELPKRSGHGMRTVCHPARELKAVQYFFLRNILNNLPTHPAATAYKIGSSIARNARQHAHSRVILKLDFVNFFNSLRVINWLRYSSDNFSSWTIDDFDFSSRILFWGLGSYTPKCLAIGAPTSPSLSNALMYEVDHKISEFASSKGYTYTRYADDITLSSSDHIIFEPAINAIRRILREARYTSVEINENKTVLASNGSARHVTGLTVTPTGEISLGRERKRLISSMVHRAINGRMPAEELPKLSGLLAFAIDVEPDFVDRLRRKYSQSAIAHIMRHGSGRI